MLMRLAFATLWRRRARTALTTAGVAVAAAMLLDMVMLGSGMRESFRGFLEQQDYHLRMTPRGTMPFDSETTIGDAAALLARIGTDPDVAGVAPVLGGKLFVTSGDSVVSGFALGIRPHIQADYIIAEGREIAAPNETVWNGALLEASGRRIGDTVRVSAGYDPQLRRFTGARELVIVGRGRFVMLSGGELAGAVTLETLQAMGGPDRANRISVALVRVRDGASADSVAARLERSEPQMSAISTEAALRFVDERLGYFRQLAFILASVSLAVGFLLVTTLVTVSVNERIGEIAVLRAIGVARWRIVAQVMLEGVALSLVGAILGVGLGLVTAEWLNGILSAFPGLPAAFEFFLFEPTAAYKSLGLLVLCGILAGVWPAWRASTLPIAKTLREEAVA